MALPEQRSGTRNNLQIWEDELAKINFAEVLESAEKLNLVAVFAEALFAQDQEDFVVEEEPFREITSVVREQHVLSNHPRKNPSLSHKLTLEEKECRQYLEMRQAKVKFIEIDCTNFTLEWRGRERVVAFQISICHANKLELGKENTQKSSKYNLDEISHHTVRCKEGDRIDLQLYLGKLGYLDSSLVLSGIFCRLCKQ